MLVRIASLFVVWALVALPLLADESYRSHPPLRRAPPPSKRPMNEGRGYFVDASQGDDAAAGSEQQPWRTLQRGIDQLRPGDTLYLREGTYYESVYLALTGSGTSPITIRAYPGERATIDAGWREFFEQPAECWEPVVGGAPDEYRSTRRYPNQRNVIGSFGDSMIGLQTYYHAQDLRAENELVDWQDWDNQRESDLKPLYCGPGLWYDRVEGRIHIRLSHTHLPAPVPNYRGETDPRKLPLVIAPFHAVPLKVDRAEHVRVEDLVLRGAGYQTIILSHAVHLTLSNLTVWCGSYGLTADATGPLRVTQCGFYGSAAPWTFRGDSSKRDYPGRPHRNLTRLCTHSLIDLDAGRESSVYATPQNDHWEIDHCEFTESDDGVYLGSVNVQFHHNVLDSLKDDGIYLSPMYYRHRLDQKDPEIHIYANRFSKMLTALAYGGDQTETRDRIFIYRNIFDLRRDVQTSRPSAKMPDRVGTSTGKLIGDHGSPPWSALNFYHNTCLMSGARDAAMGAASGTRSGLPRRVFNNLFWHQDRLPNLIGPDPANDAIADGNVYWGPGAESLADNYFKKFHASPAFEASKQLHPGGSTSHCRVAPIELVLPGEAGGSAWSLPARSPLIDTGLTLPAEWPDPLRQLDQGAPDPGCLPSGVPMFSVGRATP